MVLKIVENPEAKKMTQAMLTDRKREKMKSSADAFEFYPNPIKVIFLDIDGVLVNRRSLKERSGLGAVGDPNCVAALNKITRETGAKLVLSSSWRFCGFEEMKLILRHWGVEADLISMTPDLTRTPTETGMPLYEAVPRGREIRKWLDETGFKIDTYVIVDDDSDMEDLRPDLVKTVFEIGLTEEDVAKAVLILN